MGAFSVIVKTSPMVRLQLYIYQYLNIRAISEEISMFQEDGHRRPVRAAWRVGHGGQREVREHHENVLQVSTTLQYSNTVQYR